MSSTPEKNGFTLIELLVYTGILTLVVLVITGMLLAFSRTFLSISNEQALERGATTALARMQLEIRNAKSVDMALSTFNASSSVLTIDTVASTTITFRIANNRIQLQSNGVDVGPLTPAGVQVVALVFRKITAPHSQAVKIELTLASGTSTTAHIASFYSTAVLRGSYAP